MKNVLWAVFISTLIAGCTGGKEVGPAGSQTISCTLRNVYSQMADLQSHGLYPYTTNSGPGPDYDQLDFARNNGVFVGIKCVYPDGTEATEYLPVWQSAAKDGIPGTEQNCVGFVIKRLLQRYGVAWNVPEKVWINDMDSPLRVIKMLSTQVVLAETSVHPPLAKFGKIYTFYDLVDGIRKGQVLPGDIVYMYLAQHADSGLLLPQHVAEYLGLDESGNPIFANDMGENDESINNIWELMDYYRVKDVAFNGLQLGAVSIHRPLSPTEVTMSLGSPRSIGNPGEYPEG